MFYYCRFYRQDLKQEISNKLPKKRRLPWLALNEVSYTQINHVFLIIMDLNLTFFKHLGIYSRNTFC